MTNTIAIHYRSGGFSDRWIEYCKAHEVDFKIVDCHRSDIIQQLEGCVALMWHFTQTYLEDMLVAHAVVESVEAAGLKVFPGRRTSWHFDDKVAQKYLLESIGAPCVPSYVFVNKQHALQWVNTVEFPKVFKLRGGAGSSNVRLVKNKKNARRLISTAFASGFSPVPRWQPLQERWWRFRRDRSITSLLNISRGCFRAAFPNPTLKRLPRQVGYAYFQDFIPDNNSDIRIIVIGERAFAIKRMVRDGDFRASGSGKVIYDPSTIPQACLEIAFSLAGRLGTQSLALDFVLFGSKPLIVEMSYAFKAAAYNPCPGYWKQDLTWVPGEFRAEDFMIEDLLRILEGSAE